MKDKLPELVVTMDGKILDDQSAAIQAFKARCSKDLGDKISQSLAEENHHLNRRIIELNAAVLILKDLVEIERRDSTNNPTLIATDEHRSLVWRNASNWMDAYGKKLR